MSNTAIVKSYFRNNPRFGRTTTLTVDGVAVLTVMGVATKANMLRALSKQATK